MDSLPAPDHLDGLAEADEADALFRETCRSAPGTYPRPFDLLIVDEAHNVAPPGAATTRSTPADTCDPRLAPYFEHRLFLTATPHNGYTESSRRCSNSWTPSASRAESTSRTSIWQAMVRRSRSDRRRAEAAAQFPKRSSCHRGPLLEDERDAYSASRADTHEPAERSPRIDAERSATEFVAQAAEEAALLVAGGIRQHARRPPSTPSEDATAERRVRVLSIHILRRAIDEADEEYDDDEQATRTHAEAVGTSAGEQRDRAGSTRSSARPTWARWAERAPGPGRQGEALIAWLDQ